MSRATQVGSTSLSVARKSALTAEVAPCAPLQVGKRPAADLGLELAPACVGLVEAGGERAEGIPVAAGLGLLEDALQGVPRPPLEGNVRDHLEQDVALEDAVA